jgi:N-acetylglucosaminyl-diphospho-decaprenol L-rhamnosyltransferase
MDLSICILTHCQPELLPRCVASCLSEVKRAGIAGEVIVIDNASTDGSPQRVWEEFPAIRVLRNEENLGFAQANNQAIRISGGRYVLILNDDVVLREGSLIALLRIMDSDPRIGAAGPKLLNADGSMQLGFTNRRFPHFLGCLALVFALGRSLERHTCTRRLFGWSRDLERTGEAEHLAAACLLARREALDHIGLFDEGFYYWFEDVDLCYRLAKAGWKIVYVAEARVTHHWSASIGKIAGPQRVAMFFRSQTRYLRKHWSTPKYVFLRLAAISILLLDLPLLVLKKWLGTASEAERSAWLRNYLPMLRSFLIDWH